MNKVWYCGLGFALVVNAIAEEEIQQLETIEVIGNYSNAVGTSDSASQGVVTPKMFEQRPILRPGEVLETVPGLIITQHSGDGKANQYFLRGYNLDHGTDFAAFVAGMPVNMPTHAHGQGYTDLNFLIPELISRINYAKGPYFAKNGDFGSAGSARISYAENLKQQLGQITLGQFGYRRALAVGAPRLGSGRLTIAAEFQHNDGPWENPADFTSFTALHATRWVMRKMDLMSQAWHIPPTGIPPIKFRKAQSTRASPVCMARLIAPMAASKIATAFPRNGVVRGKELAQREALF